MKAKVGLCLSVLVCLAFVALASGGEKQESPLDKLGKPAAPLNNLQWIKGVPVTLEKGSVYVVEFWATWCPPCRTSIPHLTKLQHQFKDKGVTIIGISNETADVVKPFVAEKAGDMDYTVAVDPFRGVSDKYMKAFGVGGIPHAFIVGKDGNLLWHGHPMDKMDEVLEAVVAGQFDYVAYAKKKAAAEKEYARLVQIYKDYFTLIGNDAKKAAEGGRELVEGATNPMLLNALAWKILKDVPEENRDLELARAAAAKAVVLTAEKNPAVLDTYALALYELGKKYVGQAVIYQEKAVDMTENEQAKEGMKKSLERYESASVE